MQQTREDQRVYCESCVTISRHLRQVNGFRECWLIVCNPGSLKIPILRRNTRPELFLSGNTDLRRFTFKTR